MAVPSSYSVAVVAWPRNPNGTFAVDLHFHPPDPTRFQSFSLSCLSLFLSSSFNHSNQFLSIIHIFDKAIQNSSFLCLSVSLRIYHYTSLPLWPLIFVPSRS